MLERELSAYRLVNGRFIESTSDVEIDTLTEAQENTSDLANVQSHLKRSLELLTDRKAPDYRNSIIEFDDAKFMIVACSAFINYLTAKASKTNSLLK